MLPEYFEFSLPTRVIYGIGLLENPQALGQALKPFGSRKAMLVTDAELTSAGVSETVRSHFSATEIRIVCTFDNIPAAPTTETVTACAESAKENDCDMIIAAGGGNVIDTAKAANILIVKGGELRDHMGAYLLDPEESLLPFLVIPTTAGTGAEVTRLAMITDTEKSQKLPFTETHFLPKLAILDPKMTTHMSKIETAASGMDALTHAIEAYVDREWSPPSDALALHAVRLIAENILAACAHPDDLEARGGMLVGSFLAGAAFSHSMVGMAHAMAHALEEIYKIPHGIANALLLPEVMEYNFDACTDRYADIALALGLDYPQWISMSRSLIKSAGFGWPLPEKGPVQWLKQRAHTARNRAAKAVGNLNFIDTWTRKQAAKFGAERIRVLNQQLAYLTEMPLNLKGAGIDDKFEKIEDVAAAAMEDGAMLYNPVSPDREDVIRMLKTLYDRDATPLPVDPDDLRPRRAGGTPKEMENVFDDEEMVYDVLGDFFERLKQETDVERALFRTDLCVQFVLTDPNGVITIDAREDEVQIHRGAFTGTPEVTLTMSADYAHRFWHGKANLLTALPRRQVKAKGNLPKLLRMLPVLRPAFDRYPQYLREKGLGHMVME